MADEFSVSVVKITSEVNVSWTHSLFFCFLTNEMVVLSKVCKPDNRESHNYLSRSFTIIWSLLQSTFVGCEFFCESKLLIFLLCVRQTWKTQLILAFFYLRGDLPLNGKESNTCMHGLAVYVKEGLHFALDFSLKNSEDSCFWLVLHYFISYFFSHMDYCLCLCTQFLLLFQT